MLIDTAKRRSHPAFKAALLLAGVVIVETMFFIYNIKQQRMLMDASAGQAVSGDGLLIHSNGLGYYAWLRSLMIDRDINFDNEYDEYNGGHGYVPPPRYRTPLGYRANQWSIGPACVWAITIIPCHYALGHVVDGKSRWPNNGYSLPYQYVLGVTTLGLSFVGLFFTYGACRVFASPLCASLAAGFLTLGTSLIYYNCIEGSMAHSLGATATSALVWYWLSTYGSLRIRRWLFLGFLVGLSGLMRWQSLTLILLPLCEACLSGHLLVSFRVSKLMRAFALIAVCGLGLVLSFLPQLLAWHALYGAYFLCPIPEVKKHFFAPSLWEILFSEDRSLCFWTPITIMAIGGYAMRSKFTRSAIHSEEKGLVVRQCSVILIVAFALNVYLLAAVWGQGRMINETGNFGGIFLANSYGMRHLTEFVVLLAPGMAILLQYSSHRMFRLCVVLGASLVAWNLLLVCQACYGLISAAGGDGVKRLVVNAVWLVQSEPLLCLLQVTEWPLLAILVAFYGGRRHDVSLEERIEEFA